LEPWKNETPEQVNTSRARIHSGGGEAAAGAV
jgi:hypothetical protein